MEKSNEQLIPEFDNVPPQQVKALEKSIYASKNAEKLPEFCPGCGHLLSPGEIKCYTCGWKYKPKEN